MPMDHQRLRKKMTKNNPAKRFAVIGQSVEHSMSPDIHYHFARQANINISYEKLLCEPDKLSALLCHLENQGFSGANITMPLKSRAYHLADKKSNLAQKSQSATTLQWIDKKLYCENFDGTGLIQDLTHNHQVTLQHANILILGAGTAAQNMIPALLEKIPSYLTIADKFLSKAQAIASSFQPLHEIEAISLDDLDLFSRRHPDYTLIINATRSEPIHTPMYLPDHLISQYTVAYDLNDTPHSHFLQWAQKLHAAKTIHGIGMLIEQAAAAFYYWHGIYPDTTTLLQSLHTSK